MKSNFDSLKDFPRIDFFPCRLRIRGRFDKPEKFCRDSLTHCLRSIISEPLPYSEQNHDRGEHHWPKHVVVDEVLYLRV